MKLFEMKIDGVESEEMVFSFSFDEIMAIQQMARHGIKNDSLADAFLKALRTRAEKMTPAQSLDFIATEKLKKFEGEKHA
jgi:DeoR/GlpR family transcriptional regulator of sugar metabolism